MLRKEDGLRVNETKLKTLYSDLLSKLERTSNMTREEARTELAHTLEDEVRLSNQKFIQKIEEEARQRAKNGLWISLSVQCNGIPLIK